MNGTRAVLVITMGLALLAFGCTETTVLPSGQEQTGVSVSGQGSVFGEPDVAVLTLGVESEADSVSEARQRAAESMDAVLAALKGGGVADEDIQTTRFSVQPRFEYLLNGRQVLIGFVVSNLVTVKIRAIDDTGKLVDAAVEAGGDLTRVEGLQFTIDDPSTLQDQARQEAMADARQKAETLAQAAAVELGPARSISEGGGPQPIEFSRFALEAAAPLAETPIQLGELEVRVDVQVVYDLNGR